MIRRVIKRIPGVKTILNKKFLRSQFKHDKTFFAANYSHSVETQNKVGYNMLLIVHSLEKGMSNKILRKFGREKVLELIILAKRYASYGDYADKFPFVCAINVLRSYAKLFEENGWVDEDGYRIVVDYLKNFENIKVANVGSYILHKDDFIAASAIDYKAFLSSRHSVREFLNKKLSELDIKKAVEAAILSPSACNRQMCKVYYVKNQKKAKKIISLAQGFGGFEKDTINLLVVTFDINANYMVGERNQGWLNAGLFSMNLVNAFHSIGVGSCFCQFGNSFKDEEKVKRILNIPCNERVAVFIAAGYYCDEMPIPYSPRKEISDVLFLR